MYNNTAPPQEGNRVVVRRVFLVGPPYLRRGSQICGKTVGRTCLFILITFGVASAMIGVVLFTADLEMVTGFWVLGLILFITGFLMVFFFCILCCLARRMYNSLPSNHPHRAKQLRSNSIPTQASSYQLLPMRQTASYISPPGGQTGDCPTASRGQTVGYSSLRGGQTFFGCPVTTDGGQNFGYSTLRGGQTVIGCPSTLEEHQNFGYSTLREEQYVGYLDSPQRGEALGYSTLRGEQPRVYQTTQRVQQTPSYLTPFGGQYVSYSASPTRRIIGHQTPPRQYSVCFPIPTIGQADPSLTHPLLSREGGITPTPSSLVYPEVDNPPPYSSIVNDS